MPKIKTNKTASKKFKVKKNGSITRGKAFASHNTAKKSAKRKMRLRKMTTLDKTNLKTAKKLLPNNI